MPGWLAWVDGIMGSITNQSSQQQTPEHARDIHHGAWRFKPPPGRRLVRELPLPTAMASATALSSFGASSQDARDGCDRLAGELGQAIPINAPTMICTWSLLAQDASTPTDGSQGGPFKTMERASCPKLYMRAAPPVQHHRPIHVLLYPRLDLTCSPSAP